ncbi:hypothetical protein HDU96_009191, partial [Phlyctochytrium bullatum]
MQDRADHITFRSDVNPRQEILPPAAPFNQPASSRRSSRFSVSRRSPATAATTQPVPYAIHSASLPTEPAAQKSSAQPKYASLYAKHAQEAALQVFIQIKSMMATAFVATAAAAAVLTVAPATNTLAAIIISTAASVASGVATM